MPLLATAYPSPPSPGKGWLALGLGGRVPRSTTEPPAGISDNSLRPEPGPRINGNAVSPLPLPLAVARFGWDRMAMPSRTAMRHASRLTRERAVYVRNGSTTRLLRAPASSTTKIQGRRCAAATGSTCQNARAPFLVATTRAPQLQQALTWRMLLPDSQSGVPRRHRHGVARYPD